eukprot:1903013-Prymnesium_polylepis.1
MDWSPLITRPPAARPTYPWPEAASDVMVHLSPPCTALSKARAAEAEVEGGMDMVRFSLDLVVEKGYSNWSLEN